jgi:hypothetical protein
MSLIQYATNPTISSTSRSRRCVAMLFLGAVLGSLAGPTFGQSGNATLVILPDKIELVGTTDAQIILAHQRLPNGELGRQWLASEISWQSSNPEVARVEEGVVIPVGSGTTRLTAQVGTDTAQADVSVQIPNPTTPRSFRHDVLPVFSRLGCNSGACHGALAGKGGFRLSLRGYDPVTDHHNITRQMRGRRLELADPGQSLLLTKPTGAVPHKGGVRFTTDSTDYQILAEWISTGASGPANNDPLVERLEVVPSISKVEVGEKLRFFVRAYFSDGQSRDVTRWTKFTSTDEAVARVDDDGFVEVIGNGEGAISAWYSSQLAVGRVSSSYANKVAPKVYEQLIENNFIDTYVHQQLKRLDLPPSPPVDDGQFLRRVFLDCIGRLPSLAETEEFLASEDPAKRGKIIDHLLERSEFADYWSYRFSDILLINGTKLRPEAVKSFYKWIHENVEQNTPWDQFVREIVTAKGSSFENGATNFYALHQDPETMTENICQAFMGLSIGCAKCHNHPLEKWTNDQYYGMANLFARVRAKGWGGDPRNGDGSRTIFVDSKGDLIQPLTGKPQRPTPLEGEPLDFDDPGDRRDYLADWLTSKDNPYFARSITNRIWANYFGVGLVEPVDDMRVSNPSSNEALLTALAAYLVNNDYDLKSLMRLMMGSATYQRSSQPLPGNATESRFYSRYYPKRLMAEVLLDALSDVTEVPTEFNQILFPGADVAATDFYPQGTRALELWDSAVKSYFLKTFGRNTRDITCECERSNEPSMVQVLHLSNGETLNGKLQSEQSRVAKLLEAKTANEEILREVFLRCLCRLPTADEKAQLTVLLEESQAAEDPVAERLAVEDLFWSLMTSREFLFNH